jgi:hypothetical protein
MDLEALAVLIERGGDAPDGRFVADGRARRRIQGWAAATTRSCFKAIPLVN